LSPPRAAQKFIKDKLLISKINNNSKPNKIRKISKMKQNIYLKMTSTIVSTGLNNIIKLLIHNT
ncbi:hypothetical protein MMJ59_12100, partial [Enterococcus cecorum]|uniref:hypothetical protein n=1 Tax=Enterococcus cecorum TaxID=44008 RepID=UPI001FAB4082